MVWKAMADRVLFDMGRSTADSRITYAKILSYLSEARHQLQDKTNAVKCMKDIDLSVPDDPDTGEYNIGCSVRSVSMALYSSDTNDTSIPWQPMNQVPYETFEQLLYSGAFSPANRDQDRPGIPFSTFTVPSVSVFNGKLRIYPATEVGSVRLKFIPHLPQYYPDDYTDWAAFGQNPAAAMAIYGPESVFLPATEGMIAFAKFMLAESFPNEIRTYGSLIPGWQRDWERCAGRINTTEVQRGRRTPSSLGVLK
jgi:hypothetical protein